MKKRELDSWDKQLRKCDKKLYEQIVAEREQRKKELAMWTKRKKQLVKDKTCENCGKPAQTMHHPKLRSEYTSFEEYLNEPNLKPACHWCHYTVLHGWNPYHMLWRKCRYRNNLEINSLPEYRQKQAIYQNFCNQCQVKDKCLYVPVVTFGLH